MIPIFLYTILVLINFALLIYAVVDHRNRLYANIFVLVLAGVMSFYLAEAAISDVVYDGVVTTIMDSPSIWNFMRLVGTGAFAYALITIYEVLNEQFEAKKSREEQELEGEDWQ